VSEDNLLRRGITVIEKLAARGELTTESLRKETQVSRTSVYRILRILEDMGYVSRVKNGAEDSWRLELRVLDLSTGVLSRLDLKTEIRDILTALADDTHEIVQLAFFDRGKVVIRDNIRKHPSIINVAHEGSVLEINECVAGLVFAAYLDKEELDGILSRAVLPRLTEYTITDPRRFKSELRRVRENGYAVDDQYYAIGHRCIGAPVYDHTGKVVAEINISGHMRTLSDGHIEKLAKKVKRSAREASLRMGYRAKE
jgi:IclR family acetate operon transcriptional repressor